MFRLLQIPGPEDIDLVADRSVHHSTYETLVGKPHVLEIPFDDVDCRHARGPHTVLLLGPTAVLDRGGLTVFSRPPLAIDIIIQFNQIVHGFPLRDPQDLVVAAFAHDIANVERLHFDVVKELTQLLLAGI